MASTSKGTVRRDRGRGRRRRLVLIAHDGRYRECERFLRIEDERGTVAVTVGGSTRGRIEQTSRGWEIRSVIGVIDESMMTILDRSGSRIVEMLGGEVVDDIFERQHR